MLKILPRVYWPSAAFPAVVQAQRIVEYYGKAVGGCSDNLPIASSDLPVELYTHLNFAFALINDEGVIAIDKEGDDVTYKALNDLKAEKPTLHTAITAGGWDMNMAHYFETVSTAENRQNFIKSAIAFRKFNLSLSFSGVTFTLEDPKRTAPGSPTIGLGKEGCQEKGAMT
ncbi:hypothetical protein BGZ79_007498 [Entomortierella chlamydospora]|nr:hypothetical protein BGZ79_007498 [Entomortierella chlamydospora]